ncbi:MAG: protein kinase [Rhodopirellula sp.]|nr:protein kinase [Rhodopirellula sp.]
MATTSQCPETNLLQALLDGNLAEASQASLESHLKTCQSCRARLDELTGQVDLLPDAARKEVSQEPGGDSGLQRAVERLRAQGPSGGDCSAESPTEAEERCVAGLSLDFLDPPTQPQTVGQLGRYEITGVIGQGGMGVVLKARDPALNRVVAIKVLSPHFASSATAGKRFTREAQMAAAVSHDHVVTIHAVDAAKGLPFLVMEYIAGVSLEERIRRTGPLKVEEVLRIGMQAASGLAAAHAQGLVHRDIKPSNILLENGVERVKITDFGLARVVHEAKITQTGVVAGTPEYMSPEQAKGEEIDRRSDLFSLGCVLYAMCTGRSPFRATTVTGAIHRVCEDTPRPIRETNPDIPDWLTEIIDRLLAKKPEERFQTASEVADILGQYLAHVQQPSRVSLPARPGIPPKAVIARRWLPAALVTIAAGILLAGVGFWLLPKSAETPFDREPPRVAHAPTSPSPAGPSSQSAPMPQARFFHVDLALKANRFLTESAEPKSPQNSLAEVSVYYSARSRDGSPAGPRV